MQLVQVKFQAEIRKPGNVVQELQLVGVRSHPEQLGSHLTQKPSMSVKKPVPQLEQVPFSREGLRVPDTHDVQLFAFPEHVAQEVEQL